MQLGVKKTSHVTFKWMYKVLSSNHISCMENKWLLGIKMAPVSAILHLYYVTGLILIMFYKYNTPINLKNVHKYITWVLYKDFPPLRQYSKWLIGHAEYSSIPNESAEQCLVSR